MKKREFKLNLAFDAAHVTDLNLRRLRRYVKDLSPGYDPAKHAKQRRLRVEVLGRQVLGRRIRAFSPYSGK